MEKSSGVGSFTRRVVLLKDSDCVKHDGKIFMPTTIDMAKIKKPHTGQYNKEVLFSKIMSEEVVRQTLQKAFPLFNLTGRFYCASFSQGSTAFIFHGNPRVWDGKMLRKTVRGNSVLYILLEDDQIPQGSPFKTNDVTISSVPVAQSNLSQPTLSDTSTTIMVQNTLQPWNAFPSQECNFFLGPSTAKVDMIKSEGTSEIQNYQVPFQGTLLNSSEMPQESAHGTNNATNSSAPVASSNMNQPTSSESSEISMDQSNMYPLNDSPMLDYTAPWDIMMLQESAHETNNATISSALVALSTLNQTTSMSDTSATVMVQNTLQPQNDYSTQEAALQNMDQLTSRESSATFTDQNNMDPWNDSPTSEYIACIDRVLSTPGFTESQNAAPAAGGGLNLETALDQSMEMSDSSADNHNTTSGISGLDHNLSSDDLSPHEDEHFVFSVTPEKVPLQGAKFCRFSSDRALPGNVQSAFAVFEFNLGTVEVRRFGEDSLIGEIIPPSNKPGKVKISLRAGNRELGGAEIWYYHKGEEAVKQIIKDPELLKHFFQKYSETLSNRNNTTASGADAQNSGICGSTEPVQMLCVLVYAAAEIGGQQFIEMIFNSSAGRVVYDRYKDSSALPEAIAREYGHEKTATFLEEITSRFSKEASEAQNYPQTIDWSELVRAAEEAQKQPGLNTEEESNHLDSNVVKDTGYLGDIDTSSNESCESGSSESEDNIPWATSKEMNYRVDELSEIASAYEDQEFGIKKAAVSQSLMYFCETGHFKREKVNSTVSKKVVLPTLEGWQLSLFQDSFIRKAPGLKHLRSLNRCDTSFFLGPEQESIQYRIITEYEKWCLLFKYMKYSWLHSRKFAAEGGQFVEKFNRETQAVMMGASFGCTEDLLRIQSTRELVTTSENPGLAVQRNSTQGLKKHCTTSNLWVLTCLCRPARNILFVYVADNGDVLPQKAYFDDDRYKLSVQYWQWQRYCSSLFDVQSRLQEMRKLSEEMRPEFGPTLPPTYNAKMLPQVQGKHVLRHTECFPTWLYTMIHQCWVHAPLERPPFIVIFDGISSRTPGKSLIVTWLSHYNHGKSLPLNKYQSEDPCLVNDKTNPPSSNINVTYYRSERKEKLYEELLLGDDEINNEEELPLITAHPRSKIFHGVSKEMGDAQNEVNVKASSICPPGYKRISGKQKIGLHYSEARSLSATRCLGKRPEETRKRLAKSASQTAFILTIDKDDENPDGDLRKSLGEGLAKSTSSTEFNLTIDKDGNNADGDLRKNLGEGLAKSTSSTEFNLTIDGDGNNPDGDLRKSLGEGLAKSTSSTDFNLAIEKDGNNPDGDLSKSLGEGSAKTTSSIAFVSTMNSKHGYLREDRGIDLGEGLAKSASSTAFTLTINSVDGNLGEEWGKSFGEGLAKTTSLTAFTLKINGIHRCLLIDWIKGLGEGLAESTSLTAFTLRINGFNGCVGGDWGKGLGEGLAESTSLTAFTLKINGFNGCVGGDWGKGLGEGLAKSKSLTAFTLTLNGFNGCVDGDWGKGLGKGLAKSTSLKAFTLKINGLIVYLDGDWGKDLVEGLAKSTSLTAFTLIINRKHSDLGEDWRKGLGKGITQSALSTEFNRTIDKDGNNPDEDLSKSLGEGSAKTTSSIAFVSTMNSKHRYLREDRGTDLGEGLAKSTSSIAFTSKINGKYGHWCKDCGIGLVEGLANGASSAVFTLTIDSVDGYLGEDWGKGLGQGLVKTTSLNAFTLTINRGHKYLLKDCTKGLGEDLAESTSSTAFTLTLDKSLAESTSLTAFTLTINSGHRFLHKDWAKGLGEGLVESTSLTAFTLTMNSVDGYPGEDWGKGLGEGLGKSTSLTAFTLTINSRNENLGEDWGKGLAEGLAESTSLTAFTLTMNSVDGYPGEEWGKCLGEGLAKSTSLTAFTLKINREHEYLRGDWGKGLGEGLAESNSLTAFTLTINSVNGCLGGDWGKGLAEGLGESKSLTAFTLTINSKHGCLQEDWGKGLGEGLAKSTSLTAFTLTINNDGGCLHGDWGKGLGESLAKSTLLTAFTLKINNKFSCLDGNWGKGLGEGLGKSTSLIAFTLTVIGKGECLLGDWGEGLGGGLAESTSLSAFTLTINSVRHKLSGDWGRSLGESLSKSMSLTAFTLTMNSVDTCLFGDWGEGLAKGLAKSSSLTTFTLKINSKRPYLRGNWGKGLGEGLAKNTSLTEFTLLVNNYGGYLCIDWGEALGKGLAESKSLTSFTLIGIMDICLIGTWVEGLRGSFRNREFFLSDNVKITDRSALNELISSFQHDTGLREPAVL